ncbi:hypothetical protein ACAG25_03700 [Mycobacterium sp. pV006]|uniref:hypothetical protein n=1 Tax=Mycobacterium sp. pV006 TaxID=3238983 RepID=UPI00351B7C40
MRAGYPVAFGLLMVPAAAAGATRAGWAVAALAGIAVLLSIRIAAMASAAVLLCILTVLLGPPAPMSTAVAGLAAAAYLSLRHNRNRVSVPIMVGAVAFTAVATLAVAVPPELPWVPLLAPIGLLVAYVVALRPFVAD